MTTQFTLGMRASCPDGDCGVIRRMILDPVARTVTHLVIAHRHHDADGRLVPIELAGTEPAGTGEGEIRLGCTMAEFTRLEPAEEVELIDDPRYEGGGYGEVGRFGVGAAVPGTALGMPVGHGPEAVVSETVPPGETDLVRHERVHAVDGEIGQVEGFVVNRADHKVTHVLLKEGHLWGRKEVAIPVGAVADLENGIRLSITKKQVEDLPPLGRA